MLPEDDELTRVLAVYASYIAKEVQADSLTQSASLKPTAELELDDKQLPIAIQRVN